MANGHTALVLVDLQNDFLHPDGAYGRAGQTEPSLAELPARLRPLLDACRSAGVLTVATLFTLAPGRNGRPIISQHLAALRPFLSAGDFEPGTWGHRLVDELTPVDCSIDKVAYSAFHQSRLDHVLRASGIESLLVAGIVTNGGVASTVRGAHTLGYDVTVLSDGCAAFSPAAHDDTIASLRHIVDVVTVAEALARVSSTG